MSSCFHCGLPASSQYTASIGSQTREFCCPGCKAVALTICESGLGNYYQYRDKPGLKPEVSESSYSAYDLPDVQNGFVDSDGELSTARLSVGGISCAACAWLIEHQLQQLVGIDAVRVNATTRQVNVRWKINEVKLSEIFSALSRIGYDPKPAQHQDAHSMRQREYHQSLLRLGVAGIGMMQVGMVAVALYAGGEQGISAYWQAVLRWVSLIVATPVILFSAQPFFKSAFRAIKQRHLNMDVPVSIALLLAYGASIWATLSNSGEVYFDSVSMFTFFLLLGRFLEMRARHSGAFESENLMQLLPLTVKRLLPDSSSENFSEEVPIGAIKPGEKLWISAGATIPADGILEKEYASVDESLLTGESVLVKKAKGDTLVAGTHNGDTAFSMTVSATGKETQLAAIERMVEQAELEKPRQIALADKIAGRFVGAVLSIALVVVGFWWYRDASQVLWVVLSILVVTCPCALSLATPAALTAGTNRSRELGLLILSGHVLEALTKITHVVFDKTGTLTFGQLELVETRVVAQNHIPAIDIISALEKHSSHPIARAFKNTSENPDLLIAENVNIYGGEGVEGLIDGVLYRFGKIEFCAEIIPFEEALQYPDDGMWQLLVNTNGPVAWTKLSDKLRPSAADAVAQLSKKYGKIALLSGDREATVAKVANELHISNAVFDAKPDTKLTWLKTLQSENSKVLMVGDGINDVPVLTVADVSVAMGSATQLAQTKADCILVKTDLTVLPKAISLAGKVNKVIKQNLYWAIGYNLVALPAAASGIVPPWLAAIGMSLSSLIVVVNAMRI